VPVSSETQKYAFFDVDGTVIARDSFRILMQEMLIKGSFWRIVLAAVLCCCLGILKLVSPVGKTQIKSALLWSATVGMGSREALRRIKKIIRVRVSPLWFLEMGEELRKLRSTGHNICYVSASGEPWLRFLLNAHDTGPKLIVGSRLMSFWGGITLRGANCIGNEKIIRLRKVLPQSALWAAAYSDHRADLPLLLASRQRFVINPTKKNKTAIHQVLGEDGFVELHWKPIESLRNENH
jgi:phosphatidylglycerophosphatase C